MTKKVFWQDTYLTELTTTITHIDGTDVELAATIFYAESGGQESDSGSIGSIPVIKAEKQGLSIRYTLAHQPDFNLGDEVVIKIDWPRRYALMKLHFAAEVVLELINQNYALEKIGAHISQDKSRIDFLTSQPISPLLADIQQQAQAIIDSDQTIESDFSDQQQQRRYWKVTGFAQVPCGGTHLKRTSEVGQIRLKRKNIGKGKERIEISLVDG